MFAGENPSLQKIWKLSRPPTTLAIGIDKTESSFTEASVISTEGMLSELHPTIGIAVQATTRRLQKIICPGQKDSGYF